MTKCYYNEKECKHANWDDDDFKCLAIDPSQCPENQAIMKLIKQGHTHHCACRIHWGDGECECSKGVKEKP